VYARRLQEQVASIRRQEHAFHALASRTGVRVKLLHAIADGRFGDLPSGLYGRAAIRAVAASLALPVDEVIAECAPLLAEVDDPIAGLARVRGLRAAPARRREVLHADVVPSAIWRLGAAATIDGLIVAGLLLVVVAATATIPDAHLHAMSGSAAPAFTVFAVALAAWYFLLFGGVAGMTAGTFAARPSTSIRPAEGSDAHAVMVRAARCACRDLRFLQVLGAHTGRWIAAERARHRGPLGMRV
jgi:hypothetical protein